MENWESEVDKDWAEELSPDASPAQTPEAASALEGEQPGAEAKPKRDVSGGLETFLILRVFVAMMAAFVLTFTFVARLIVVSGPSMENTLINGDLMLVWSLGYTPKAGDVVVLTQRSYQEDSIVKRVIATEGQRVDINYASGTVHVDGELLDEPYIKERMVLPSFGEGNNHVTVPEGCIFVMGDNRNHSADSRFPAIGIVDERCVIGRGVAVIFPFHHWKGL